MSLKLNSSGGGSITLQEPSTASNRTLTLPDNTGNLISSADSGTITQGMLASAVTATGPNFRAHSSADVTLTSANTTYIATLNNEDYDNGGCYNNTGSTLTLNGLSAPAYSFTPNVAGYYHINVRSFVSNPSGVVYGLAYVLKNGNMAAVTSYLNGLSGTLTEMHGVYSDIVYLNGTGDYLQVYAAAGANNSSLRANTLWTYFSGNLVRKA